MSEHIFTTENGQEIPVIIETRRGLRNITIRPKTSPKLEIHISKPWIVPSAEALRFLETKHRWLERIFTNAPTKTTLKPGDYIEFLGKKYLLNHNPNQHTNTICNNTIIVGGDIRMFERRIRDLIKTQLLQEIKTIIHTTPKDFWPKRIALRDTSTRWGSCSSTGTMSFSWRLAFAPYDVMRYVIIHELAHTQHMDHSPEFWHTVSELYGFGVERARRWLNVHGAELHKYL